jgi:hypothetical protein
MTHTILAVEDEHDLREMIRDAIELNARTSRASEGPRPGRRF